MSKLTKLLFRPHRFFADIGSGRRPAPAAPAESGRPAPGPSTLTVPLGGEPPRDPAWVPPSAALGLYEACLHSGEGPDGLSHLMMWIPHLLEAGISFYVLVRDPKLQALVRQTYGDLAVLCAKGPLEVEDIFRAQPLLRAVFYPSNTGNNIHLLRFNHLTHIFLGHGDSDKSGSAHKFFRVYDEVWIAGQAHRDRFVNAGFSMEGIRFIEVGRPGSRALLQAKAAAGAARWQAGEPKSFLYLPTWEGTYAEQDYSSMAIANLLADRIGALPQTRLAVKFHPSSGKRLALYRGIDEAVRGEMRKRGREGMCWVADRMEPLPSCILRANMFICDISAVITECLAGDGPIFTYLPRDRPIITSASRMQTAEFTYTFSSVDELLARIAALDRDGDVLAEARGRAREYFLGATATLAGAFTAAVRRVAGR